MALWFSGIDSDFTEKLNSELSKRAIADSYNILGNAFLSAYKNKEVASFHLEKSGLIIQWLQIVRSCDIIYGFNNTQEFKEVLEKSFDLRYKRHLSDQEIFEAQEKLFS